MKQTILTLLLVCAALTCHAQKFSPNDYRQRFEAYVAKEAGLTKEEAAKFFPLYQEMKDKQRVFFHEIRHITLRTDVQKTSEATFRQLNDKVCELHIQTDKVELEYINRFRKIISDKKYFLVKKAEESFQHQELRHKTSGGGRRK